MRGYYVANPAVRVVMLSASTWHTNLLVALAESVAQERCDAYLRKILHIQYAIINYLSHPQVICKKIDRIMTP
ncbi:MAG: hypothetical protein ACR5K7_02420 [Symbiopectobacterium sp.]